MQSQPGRSAGHRETELRPAERGSVCSHEGQQSVVLCAHRWNAVWTVPAGWVPGGGSLCSWHTEGSALVAREWQRAPCVPSSLGCGVGWTCSRCLWGFTTLLACLLSGGDDQCSGYHEGGLWSGENQRLENVQQPPPEQAPQEAEAGGCFLCSPGLQQPVRAEAKDLWVEGKS